MKSLGLAALLGDKRQFESGVYLGIVAESMAQLSSYRQGHGLVFSTLSELHGSTFPKPDKAVRLDLDTAAYLLELLPILDKCAVRTVEVTDHDLASPHAKLSMFPRNLLVRNHYNVLRVPSNRYGRGLVEVKRNLGLAS